MQKHIVVVGAGFGGLNAVRELAKDPSVRVTLVDQNNSHVFLPLLYQVAAAGLEATQIAFPIRAYLRRFPRARFHLGRAEGVDLKEKTLWVEGQPIPYDYLVVAAGSKSNDFGIPGVAEHAFGLKTLKEAKEIRDRILSACEEAVHTPDPERKRALLTWVIVGGGPTGVELAGALGELRNHVIRRDYPELDPREIRIILIEAGPRVLNHLSPASSAYAQRFLERLGVEVMTRAMVAEVTPSGVKLKDGAFIPSFTTVWSAGVAGAALPGLPAERNGRVPTTPELHLEGDPHVYVVGDVNLLINPNTGRPYPQVAQVAIQQGTLAGRNILRHLHGQSLRPFKYKDKGNMVTLGRNHAVLESGRLRLMGFPAWVAWLGVHLMYLTGGRNRFMVMANWAYSYFTYDFAVRTLQHRHLFPALELPEAQPHPDPTRA